MYTRARVDDSGLGGRAAPGQPIMEQLTPTTNVTAGSATLTAESILSGWLQRSGPAGGFTDTWPTADSIITAMLNAGLGPQVGDCFKLIYQNTVAQAMTFAAGTGIITGVGTLNVAASVIRTYYHTLLSTKPSVILVGNTVDTGELITGISAADCARVMPGMGISGTNIAGGATVIGVAPDLGTIYVSAAGVTGNGTMIALTFFPRIRLDSVGVATA